uniref:Uncharacterized protein n=1 Tax=Stomoxys calcitrans TaxID=35570 RepID=A0A1I8QAD9_STOCA
MISTNVSICFLKDMDCVAMAELSIMDSQTLNCKARCLSGCQELLFFPDLFVSPLAAKNYSLLNPYFKNISKAVVSRDLAQVLFYYQENFFRGNTKVPYTGFTEFMSQTGGVMSLMVGFSVMSIAEFSYFGIFKSFLDMLLHRSPKILDVKDDLEQNEAENMNEDNSMDKFHHRMLFKRRKSLHSRIMVWDRDNLEQYKEKY